MSTSEKGTDFMTPWPLPILVHSPGDPAGKTWRHPFSPPMSTKAIACPASKTWDGVDRLTRAIVYHHPSTQVYVPIFSAGTN